MLNATIRTARYFTSPVLAIRWAAEFLDDKITTPLHRKHLNYYSTRKISLADGIAKAMNVDIQMVEQTLNSLPDFLTSDNPESGLTIKWSSSIELASITYAVVKLLKPDVVVETGVGAGFSSWTILHAMNENNRGQLFSIDLPTPNTELLPMVGYLVPKKLQDRWDLRTGPSQRLLPKILEENPNIDIFQHDSRHSYSNQIREYVTAWPHITSNGILISDDINNDALHDACRQWKKEPMIIEQRKHSPIGLVSQR